MAVGKAEEALAQAKSKGRNRITVMGETAVWSKESKDSLVHRQELSGQYPGSSFENNEILKDHICVHDAYGGIKDEDVNALTFEELYLFSKEIEKFYNEDLISRGFIHRLLDAKKVFFHKEYTPNDQKIVEKPNLMCLPHLLYNITRNVKRDAQDTLKSRMVTTGETPQYVRQAYFPCKRVLMRTKQ